tara:strand:+ start:8400 stop:8876 length:477 start_codon:yes stop_codon:yes gene_type:complete
MKKNKKSKFILGFLLGGAVGAGVLFAVTKKKGIKIPNSIIDSREEIREHGKGFIDELRQHVSPSIQSVKVNAIPVYDRVVDSIIPVVEDALDRGVSLIEDLRNNVSPAAEEIRSKVDAFSSYENLDDSKNEINSTDHLTSSLDDSDIAPKKTDTHLMN